MKLVIVGLVIMLISLWCLLVSCLILLYLVVVCWLFYRMVRWRILLFWLRKIDLCIWFDRLIVLMLVGLSLVVLIM